MIVKCVWEHNEKDTLLYAVDYIGAYTRGESLDVALLKMPNEIAAYIKWLGETVPEEIKVEIVGEKESDLNIKDADSDVLFEGEKEPLTVDEYDKLKTLALKSAKDFLLLYESIPDKNAMVSAPRKTFYGQVPRTADEMYEHTKNVNEYYFGEIEIDADNEGDIYECRRRGFEALEAKDDFLQNPVIEGSYGEEWSLRKVLRRFIWHDRIHARAMYRMAIKAFGEKNVEDPFYFGNKAEGYKNVRIINVCATNIRDAGRIHSESWKESHKGFCSAEFIARHTVEAQIEYIRKEMSQGKLFYMLIDQNPVGIVSVCGNLIENLYVLPAEQNKGYGTELLRYAIEKCDGNPTLWILSNNKSAYHLYSKNGFIESGNRKHLKEGLYEIEMIMKA